MAADSDEDADLDSDADLDGPYLSARARYAVGLSSAAILAIVAFVFLEGTLRWIVVGLAFAEALLLPQIMKLRSRRTAP